MSRDAKVKHAVYRHFADTGERPAPDQIASAIGSDTESVIESYRRLANERALVLEEDGVSIRMALPFSGIPTQHVVESAGVHYFANCAWDALGIPAALQREAEVRSRCGQSEEELVLQVGRDGPPASDWVYHSLVPAARWWDDIVFT